MTIQYPTDDTDQSIMAAIKAGNQQALGKLYDKYSPSLLGIINKTTGIGKIAEEVLQQAFLEIWKHRARYDGGSEKLLVWMIKITMQVARVTVGRSGNFESIRLQQLVFSKATIAD